MDRVAELLKHVTKNKEGIEIGPYFNPLVPRRDGFRSVSLDVFAQDDLRKMAAEDPAVPNDRIDLIEQVELLGPAQDIEILVRQKFGGRKFDYIVSSHNIEHIPDPIRFLHGCKTVLKPGGYLSLAVPDHRCCFDYFLPVSTVADWLEAFFEQRKKPNNKQIFMRSFMRAEHRTADGLFSSFSLGTDPSEIFPIRNTLMPAFALWETLNKQPDHHYIDAHCWMFTPETFKLMVMDLQHLGLFPFVVEEVSNTHGNEFYVHLRSETPVLADYENRRIDLLQRISRDSRGRSQHPPRLIASNFLARLALFLKRVRSRSVGRHPST
jgi:SAM-dependent methyltransferase